MALGGTAPGLGARSGLGKEVSCYAIDAGDHLLLFDPLALPSRIEEIAADREAAIVLTCPWHRRDAQSLAERLGIPIYVPPPDEGDPNPVEGEVFTAGDRLPVGVEAFPGMEPNDLVLWIESRRALVTGDTLIDRGNGLEFPTDWAVQEVCRPSRFSTRCARCSSCRSSTCSRRTARPPIGQHSSAHCPEAQAPDSARTSTVKAGCGGSPSVPGAGLRSR